jgi:hypothetical protein
MDTSPRKFLAYCRVPRLALRCSLVWILRQQRVFVHASTQRKALIERAISAHMQQTSLKVFGLSKSLRERNLDDMVFTWVGS